MATEEYIKILRRVSPLFLAMLLLASRAQATIEIFSGGKKYTSFKAYRLSESLASAKADVNRSRVEGMHGPLANRLMHRLYVLGIESGMTKALENFYQDQTALPLPHRIFADGVEQAIKAAISSSPGVKLLISRDGKFSIMALASSQHAHQAP